MKTVEFENDNHTMVIARGFQNENEATSAIDAFLSEQGDEYGRHADGMEEDGVWYFRVTESKTLAGTLKNEIESTNEDEPNVQMFVDGSSIFWVSKDGQFVWMADHSGVADYINDEHKLVDEKTPEGVGNEGVYWMNGDFESPFHISDFIARIETVNV